MKWNIHIRVIIITTVHGAVQTNIPSSHNVVVFLLFFSPTTSGIPVSYVNTNSLLALGRKGFTEIH